MQTNERYKTLLHQFMTGKSNFLSPFRKVDKIWVHYYTKTIKIMNGEEKSASKKADNFVGRERNDNCFFG